MPAQPPGASSFELRASDQETCGQLLLLLAVRWLHFWQCLVCNGCALKLMPMPLFCTSVSNMWLENALFCLCSPIWSTWSLALREHLLTLKDHERLWASCQCWSKKRLRQRTSVNRRLSMPAPRFVVSVWPLWTATLGVQSEESLELMWCHSYLTFGLWSLNALRLRVNWP